MKQTRFNHTLSGYLQNAARRAKDRCDDCKAPIVKTGPRQIRCVPCSTVRNKLKERERDQRRRRVA